MIRVILGLIKGAILGGAVGFGAYSLGMSGGFHWLTYGLVGVVVGLFVGRPIWSHMKDPNSTFVVSVLKAVFGYVVGIGLYAIIAKAWGGFDLSISGETRNVYNWQFLCAGVIGALYGIFLEVDDAPAKDAKK